MNEDLRLIDENGQPTGKTLGIYCMCLRHSKFFTGDSTCLHDLEFAIQIASCFLVSDLYIVYDLG